MAGNAIGMCWTTILTWRKKRHIRAQLRALPARRVALAHDDTDVRLCPPLRAGWARRGETAEVRLSGWNARRVIFGAMNLGTGHRLFLACSRQRARDFQAFLEMVHQHYCGWHVALLLDEDPSHTAKSSVALAANVNMRLIWLPKRAPKLNPMDTLWGQAKDVVSANKQYASLDEQVERFVAYLSAWSNHEALIAAGVCASDFWLKAVGARAPTPAPHDGKHAAAPTKPPPSALSIQPPTRAAGPHDGKPPPHDPPHAARAPKSPPHDPPHTARARKLPPHDPPHAAYDWGSPMHDRAAGSHAPAAPPQEPPPAPTTFP